MLPNLEEHDQLQSFHSLNVCHYSNAAFDSWPAPFVCVEIQAQHWPNQCVNRCATRGRMGAKTGSSSNRYSLREYILGVSVEGRSFMSIEVCVSTSISLYGLV